MRGRARSPRHRRPHRSLVALIAAGAAAPIIAACGSGDGGNVVSLYYAPEDNLEKVIENCNNAAAGRYKIVYNKLPREADGQREQMVRRLAAEDSDMDILGLDVTWTAEFAEAGWILEWTGDNKAKAEDGTLEGPLESASWEDKLYAAPKNTNVQLLWYRSDLVGEAPETFDELIAAANELKADGGKPYQVGMTGAQYEGLVVQFNTLTASAGGNIVSEDGTKAVVDDGAVKALETLKTFATSGVASPSLSNAKEDDVRLAFQNEQMAFQLNWPFVYAAMQEAKPDLEFEWARYPGIDGPAKVTIGGFNLAVSRYSKRPNEAFEAALCIRNAENQKLSAINSGVPPTIESVYDEPEMDKAYPMKQTILDELKDAAVRPRTPAYQNASTIISTVLSPPAGIDPRQTADRLRRELQDAIDSKGVLP